MTTSGWGGLDGIRAQLRGYADEAPFARFTPDGVSLWEFKVRLVDTWRPETEKVIVRVADEHYGSLQSWVVPGRHLLVEGILHLIRWTPKDNVPRAVLVIEMTDLHPLDKEQQQNPSKAGVHVETKPARTEGEARAANAVAADRATRARQLLDAG